MFFGLRRYLGLCLVLLLALTSQSMAVARGATGPAGQMVLCTGTGPVTVFIDADGNPTGPPRFCPDHALTLLAAVALPEPGVAPVETQSRLHAVRAGLDNPFGLVPHPSARSPPCPV